MPTGRTFAARVAVAVALTLPIAGRAQDAATRPVPFAPTLTFGTGLVNTPVAWVSPDHGDLYAAFSARAVGSGRVAPRADAAYWDLTGSLEAHIAGRLTLGISLYGTEEQQVGGFGQFLLVQQRPDGPRWLPSIALGVRNLGASRYQDRFVTGQARVVDADPVAKAAGKGMINGSPTLYGVATRSFLMERSDLSVSVGFGNGLFKEDGGLGKVYNNSGTLASGLFMGARYAHRVGQDGAVALMVDNDGFDWNAGVSVSYGHLSAGIYRTELEEASSLPASKPLANFQKTALSFSYNTSLPGIIDGADQRAEAAEAQLALRRLEQEIAQRRITTQRLVAELDRAAAAADKASAQQRDLLLKQLEAERAALKAAADKLDQLQKKPPESDGRTR